MTYAFYIASVLGAAALVMLMPRRGYTPGILGALLGVATLGGLLLYMLQQTPPQVTPSVYYYVFTILAAMAAVRVITHERPIYSALYFVLTVLATMGLFLLLGAEFMVVAVIIIYAGAILVTYLFVIMLATQPPSAFEAGEAPEYDRVAREPIFASLLGFILLAAVSSAIFSSEPPINHVAFRAPVGLAAAVRMPVQLELAMQEAELISPDARILPETVNLGAGTIQVVEEGNFETVPVPPEIAFAAASAVDDIDQVGLALLEGHTLGIELAGIILLVSMVGAVVIARKYVQEEATEPGGQTHPPVTQPGEPGPKTTEGLGLPSGGTR